MRFVPTIFLAAIGAAPAGAEAPQVVTDIPAVHSLVAQVMGATGSPLLLLDQGADAHSYQLRPSQAAALAKADLVIWIGPEMSPWLERAIGAGTGARTVALLEVAGTHLLQFEDHGTEASEEGHTHDGTDPHAWLDPDNASLWLTAIAAALTEADGENSATYVANATAAAEAIAATGTALRARLSDHGGVPVMVSHDAYGYFADHFGLDVEAIASGDAADPGAARLSAVSALLASGKVACVFPEALQDGGFVEAVATDTPARIGRPLDPEGRDIAPGPGLYAELIGNLGTAIADCLAAD